MPFVSTYVFEKYSFLQANDFVVVLGIKLI